MPRPSFTSNGKKALYAGKTTIAMMVGVVTECFLCRVAREGGYDAESFDPGSVCVEGSKAYHSIHIMPFSQLWRRESTMLSLIFHLPVLKTASILSKGPEFTTCGNVTGTGMNKNKFLSPAQQKVPVPKTPVKSGSAWPNSLAAKGPLASTPKEYYHCLGFEDDVPVFDGRASKGRHFLFRPEDFNNIASMLRYGTGRNLDYFSLVAVGYTPTVWSTKREAHLSMNVQFVVLLGQAPNSATLATAGYIP
ncbi:hypothetical protein ARMSODRAFT_1022524 [Armillaria solidipes]|uniref:Uncharacterized protein n=1 Tax=Armillaria solidipes TaxID=1076256 RepID=A0A2H3B2F4_9AGAR|nr:hypothetical protein ARMSODRAFT_1022524 [Armillaria solidipes]